MEFHPDFNYTQKSRLRCFIEKRFARNCRNICQKMCNSQHGDQKELPIRPQENRPKHLSARPHLFLSEGMRGEETIFARAVAWANRNPRRQTWVCSIGKVSRSPAEGRHRTVQADCCVGAVCLM